MLVIVVICVSFIARQDYCLLFSLSSVHRTFRPYALRKISKSTVAQLLHDFLKGQTLEKKLHLLIAML